MTPCGPAFRWSGAPGPSRALSPGSPRAVSSSEDDRVRLFWPKSLFTNMLVFRYEVCLSFLAVEKNDNDGPARAAKLERNHA